MIRGLLFDLDGTLVDTHQANFEAYRRALADCGVVLSHEAFMEVVGHQAMTFLPMLAPGLSQDEYRQITERKAVYYKEVIHLSVANTALIKFLDDAGGKNRTALVTSAKRGNAENVLQHHGLTDKFDLIITSDDVATSKPSPEPYLLALEKLGLKPEEAIAFEDSAVGVQAAEAAGIAVVPIGNYTG